jgi:hypothetical protein
MSSPAILCSAEAIANAMAIVNNRFFIFIFVRLVRAGSIVVVVARSIVGGNFPFWMGALGTTSRSQERKTVWAAFHCV